MAIDKIGSKALLDCSVAAADITPGTITATKLAGSIANAKLANSTVTINGTAVALGASASIAALAWQSVVVSDGSTVTTMVAGRGYFVNNTSAAGIVKLPAGGTAGDTIAIKDYAGNFGTNNLTIQRNSHKIQGVANDGLIKTNKASLVLVYIDATKGWLYTNESNVADLQAPTFIEATGGTVTTSGDYKIHTFTGDSNFVVSEAGKGTSTFPSIADYLVIAGAGGGGENGGGAGGAGGYRESKAAASPTHTISPHTGSPLVASTGITLTAQTYPITVGSGGNANSSPGPTQATGGSNSVFATITSAGGAGGGGGNQCGATLSAGGSGGGGRANQDNAGSAGNTPPVSPPQGNAGGRGGPSRNSAGGGGGATGAGGDSVENGNADTGGAGGAGATSVITGSSVARAGGGGGGSDQGGNGAVGGTATAGGGPGGNLPGPSAANAGVAGTANTGGGGGGGTNAPDAGSSPSAGGNGGKGVVIIRYKFQ